MKPSLHCKSLNGKNSEIAEKQKGKDDMVATDPIVGATAKDMTMDEVKILADMV